MRLQSLTLTLLGALLLIVGIFILYVLSGNLSETGKAIGIALVEIGLISILYERLIKPFIDKKNEDIERLEKYEGRRCITEELQLNILLKDNIIEVYEIEKLYFIGKKNFTPLIYLDSKELNEYTINNKPRVEASIKTQKSIHLLTCLILKHTVVCMLTS